MFTESEQYTSQEEEKSPKFEQFFGPVERLQIFLDQVIGKDIQKPVFIFHLTNAGSIERRKAGLADDKFFSFSTRAFESLMMLTHRFLNQLRDPSFKVTDEKVYQPVFVVTDYEKVKTNPGFVEKSGAETGHEVEIKTPFADLSAASLFIDSAERFKDLTDYLSQATPSSEQKEKALKALNFKLEDWQEVERLSQEKSGES